jgi:hypothetical protein
MNRALPLLSAALAATLLAAPAAGQAGPSGFGVQPTAVTGVVRYAYFPTAGSIGMCAQPTYTLEHLEGTIYLASATIDLELYVDKLVKVHGATNLECPILEVTAVETDPPATLAICGTGGFGCPVRLVSGPDGLATHWFLASAAPSFLPLAPEKGAFLMSQPFVIVGPVSSTAFGSASFEFNVPLIPALAGHTLYFQNARRAVGIIGPPTQPPLQFGNLAALHIVGFTLFCEVPGC